MENDENWKKTFKIILIVSAIFGIILAIKADTINIFLDISFGFFSCLFIALAISSVFMQPEGQGA